MNNSKIFSRSTYNDSTYENNFNDIVNLTTLKIKEFTNKKLELQKGNGLLKGQKVTHETDRNHLLTTTNSKDSTCKSLVCFVLKLINYYFYRKRNIKK